MIGKTKYLFHGKDLIAMMHLAVDIGASSGRHILGWLEDGTIRLKEIYRFENRLIEKNGHLCWDIDRLFDEILNGIRAVREAGYAPETMGIDTWGVDYVLLDEQGERIGDAVAYRDSRTDGIREKMEQENGYSFAAHYAATGIQYLRFNTVYQLEAFRREHPEDMARAAHLLMVPDYLHYLLTGKITQEYTNATTTTLVNARTHDWDFDLIDSLGFPRRIFPKILPTGSVIGTFRDDIREKTGLDMRVILPATHDTGSAYISVPAKEAPSVFLSSGTWSLLGTENLEPITSEESMKANFTNEGGYEYRFRYLKNIMGLWMIQSIRRELGEALGERPSFPALIEAAKGAKHFPSLVDVDDDRFLAPPSMIGAVKDACRESGQPVPEATGEVMQTVYNSLADDYRRAIENMAQITGKKFEAVNIVGGGSQDMYLNQMTANATGLPVFAGPTEGTALGNIIVQMITEKEIADLSEARHLIRHSFDIKEVQPK
ncbi:MAG: rhamnulokinase [Clostridia bacterium]|nr:rhamnulokinase [Clostridia bacterium]